jgi:hypothetical protein
MLYNTENNVLAVTFIAIAQSIYTGPGRPPKDGSKLTHSQAVKKIATLLSAHKREKAVKTAKVVSDTINDNSIVGEVKVFDNPTPAPTVTVEKPKRKYTKKATAVTLASTEEIENIKRKIEALKAQDAALSSPEGT